MGKQQRRKPPGNPPKESNIEYWSKHSNDGIKFDAATQISLGLLGTGGIANTGKTMLNLSAKAGRHGRKSKELTTKQWEELIKQEQKRTGYTLGKPAPPRTLGPKTGEEANFLMKNSVLVGLEEIADRHKKANIPTPYLKYGGPIDNLGILSANPSLIMPQRGMNPASSAFPSSGFTMMNVSGNHLRDKKGKYKFGGFTPTDTTTGMGGIAGMGSGLLAALPTPEGKSGVGKAAASGALAGIGMGASFGPIGMAAGAVIGGLTGLFKRKKEHEAEQEQARMLAEQKRTTMKQTRYNQDAGSIGLFPTDGIEGVNNYYTALGGFPASQYEAEDGEVITYEGGGFTGGGEPTAFNDVLNNLSSGMSVIDGNSHAQGGEMIQGGEFVFSKKMKSTKELAADLNNVMGYTPKDKSYAGIAESIGRKKGMLEEKLDSHDPIAMKTAEVMMERYDEALELVAFEQELRKSKAA